MSGALVCGRPGRRPGGPSGGWRGRICDPIGSGKPPAHVLGPHPPAKCGEDDGTLGLEIVAGPTAIVVPELDRDRGSRRAAPDVVNPVWAAGSAATTDADITAQFVAGHNLHRGTRASKS